MQAYPLFFLCQFSPFFHLSWALDVTALYATLQSHQAALKALHERNVVLSSELQTLTALLDDLARGYNPNYQDMAVKGAVVAYREWRRAGQPAPAHAEAAGEDGDADQTAEGDEEPVRLKELLEEGGWDAKTVRDMADRDPLDLMEGVNGTTSLGEGETGICECSVLRVSLR